MLDFTNKGKKKPVFRVDSSMKDKPPFMASREKHLMLLTVVGLVLIIIWLIPGPTESKKVSAGEQTGDHALEQGSLDPMAYPDFSQPRSLPTDEAMAATQEQVDWFIEDPRTLLLRGFGAQTMAWVRTQLALDAESAPIPRRLPGSAAVGEQLRQGLPVLVSGTLLYAVPAPLPGLEDMQRLLLEVGEKLYIEVLASGEAASLPLGEQVNVVARYVGYDRVPSSDEGVETVQIRVFAGLRGHKADPDQAGVTNLLNLGEIDPDLGQTVWREDPQGFEGIDDLKPGFEIRPYYYLLGWVARENYHEGVYDDAPSAVDQHEALYFEPESFRGDAYTVDGYVLDAWEDTIIARDKPFGVNRVIRIWAYNYVGRTETNPETGETRQANGIGLFEISAIVDARQELPLRGHHVKAEGRFLKMRGYSVPPDYFRSRRMAEPRFTNVTYFTSLVTDGFEVEPPPQPISILLLKGAFTFIFVSMIVIMVFLAGSEKKRENTYKRPMRKLREGRRRLAQRVREGIAAEGDEALDDVEEEGEPSAEEGSTEQEAADEAEPDVSTQDESEEVQGEEGPKGDEDNEGEETQKGDAK